MKLNDHISIHSISDCSRVSYSCPQPSHPVALMLSGLDRNKYPPLKNRVLTIPLILLTRQYLVSNTAANNDRAIVPIVLPTLSIVAALGPLEVFDENAVL